MNRLASLDWQRGLLALSVMTYHLIEWRLYHLDSSKTLGRLGVYSVSMFFILSGLSMALVYNKYLCDVQSSLKFFVRRIFRIWPLLWLVITVVVLEKIRLHEGIDSTLVILNLTTLFGF